MHIRFKKAHKMRNRIVKVDEVLDVHYRKAIELIKDDIAVFEPADV